MGNTSLHSSLAQALSSVITIQFLSSFEQKVYHSGAWKDLNKIFVMNNSIWKQGNAMYEMMYGVWTKVF